MTKNSLHSVSAGLKRSAAIVSVAAVTLGFSGCIDDKYDLSDIDTTVRLEVNDLTLPINLDEILLENIISTPKEGDIIQIVDDEYVLIRKGEFESSDLEVKPIHISHPTTTPSISVFRPSLPAGAPARAVPASVSFYIHEKEASPIDYSYDDVSKEIVEMTGLGASWTINYNVSVVAKGNETSTFHLKNFVFQLPAGLEGTPSIGRYNPDDGLLTIENYTVKDNHLDFVMDVTGIDAKQAHVKFIPGKNGQNGSLEINTATGVIDGEIILELDDISISGIPEELTVTTDLVLSDITINQFSGKIKYEDSAFTIAPVELNDLPDVLNQSGTSISLVNPQIYIRVENPFAGKDVSVSTGFSLTATRQEGTPVTAEINDKMFSFTQAPVSSYCLSPEKPAKYYVDPEDADYNFANANPVGFTGLATILKGNGLPKAIDISLTPTTAVVNDFRLGTYSPVKGNYLFYSPLALGADSQIEYSSTEDGWADEDLNKLTIQHLKVTTEITNDLPFDIALTAKPLSTSGPIEDASVTPVTVKGGSTQNITIEVTGTIRNLDGIEFSAKATSENNAPSLKPTQHIALKNTKVTVKGYYDDEL